MQTGCTNKHTDPHPRLAATLYPQLLPCPHATLEASILLYLVTNTSPFPPPFLTRGEKVAKDPESNPSSTHTLRQGIGVEEGGSHVGKAENLKPDPGSRQRA